MDNQGWISLHRKMKSWEWYTDVNTCHLFLHLLLSANHEDNKHQGTMIKKGQYKTGRTKLAAETGLSEQQIRTCLKRLESTSEITITKYNKYSIITVTNWGEYQRKKEESTSEITSNQPAINQQSTTNNNDNKIIDLNLKNKKNRLDWKIQENICGDTINSAKEECKIYGENIDELYFKFNSFIEFIPDKPDIAFITWLKRYCDNKQKNKKKAPEQNKPVTQKPQGSPHSDEFNFLRWNTIRLSMGGSLATTEAEKAYYSKYKTLGELQRAENRKKAG